MMSSVLLAQLTLHGEPVEQLYSGWEATARFPVLEDLEVVLFCERDTGREACWWITSGGDYLASHALALKPDRQKELIDHLTPILHPLMDQSLINTPQHDLPVHTPLFQTLAALPTVALTEAVGLWFHHVAQGTIILSPHELVDNTPHDNDDDHDAEEDPSPFSAGRIRQVMSCRYHDEQPPTAISPFSLLPLKPQLVMKNGIGVACRFFDPVENLTFYLFWPTPPEQNISENGSPIFYYPQGPLILGDGTEASLLPTRLLVWLIQHPEHPDMIRHAPSFRLEDYGVGQISEIWKSFSSDEGSQSSTPPALSTAQSPAWDSWFSDSPAIRTPSLEPEPEPEPEPSAKAPSPPPQPLSRRRKKRKKKGRRT